MSRVVLFTPFAPHIGGGGAILRSLLAALQNAHDLEIEWCYTDSEESQPPAMPQGADSKSGKISYSYLGPDPVTSGWRSLSDIARLWGTRSTTPRLRRLTAQLASRKADVYWMVGHMEAVLMSDQLARHGHRVHFTMHDDLAYGQFSRSKRYRYLTKVANWRLKGAMHSASTMDVVCEGMRRYYLELCQKDSIVVHRFVPQLPALPPTPTFAETELTVGHIGSIYSVPECRAFCTALRNYAHSRNIPLKFIVIAGYAEKTRAIFEEFGDFIENVAHMDESKAIERLAQCHFVYAMYPFSPEMEVFRRTSSPTKVTTYIQCQRPILAHTPADSSLHQIITDFLLGQSVNSLDTKVLEQAIGLMHRGANDSVKHDRFEFAREMLHGEGNIRKLAHCLKTGKYPT